MNLTQSLLNPEILIVDNQIDNLRLLTHLLEEKGYRVRQAIDGEMAMIALQTRLPDLVLLEVKLPKIDGYEICQYVRADPSRRSIPIAFLSAIDESWSKIRAFELGANDYITKPYHPEELVARIGMYLAQALQLKQIQGQNQQLQKQVNLYEMVKTDPEDTGINPHFLLQAINATRSSITIVDALEPDYPIVYVNAGFESMTGYSLTEVKGKNCRFLQQDDKNQAAIATMRDCLHSGQECRLILRNYRKDGTLFWNEISLSPIKDGEGKVVYYIGMQADISDRIRGQEEQQRDKAALKKMNRELHELTEKLDRLANSDGLTGVANRRHFDDYLQREWERMQREKKPLSLLLLDVDCFKLYNDTYGHLLGDDCLKAVAKVINNGVTRPADLAARYGGEEFAVILPDTPSTGAEWVAKKIVQGVRNLTIPHAKTKVESRIVTISIGVATLNPQAGDRSADFIKKADKALYKAKDEGRDRFCLAKSP